MGRQPVNTGYSETDFLEMWYAALQEPFGLVVETSDVAKLKQNLYAARKSADDPALSALILITSPDSAGIAVWIAHRNLNIDPQEIMNADR